MKSMRFEWLTHMNPESATSSRTDDPAAGESYGIPMHVALCPARIPTVDRPSMGRGEIMIGLGLMIVGLALLGIFATYEHLRGRF
jgi:hypothetical protein